MGDQTRGAADGDEKLGKTRGEEESLLFAAEINVLDKAVLGFCQMMQRIISSQWEGFPHCCVSRL